MLKSTLITTLFATVATSAAAVPITISFETDEAGFIDLPDGQTNGQALSPTTPLPSGIPSFTVDADTFNVVSFQGSGFNIAANNEINISLLQGVEGLGINNNNPDASDDIDGSGSNDILIFRFEEDVTLTQIGFENFFPGDGFVFAQTLTTPNAELFDILDLPFDDTDGDEGFFDLNFTGSIFGIGAVRDGDDFLLSSLTFDVDVAPVPLPAAGWMLLAGVGGMMSMRRRKRS